MKIEFLGAAQTVSGSNYLVTTETEQFIIDCGMFQGNAEMESKNAIPFPYDPEKLNFAILSHSHIDHSGRLPKLVKDGFKGQIYATDATCDLAEIMLKDSAKIQENDIEWENKKRQRAGKPLLEPIYTIKDAENALFQFRPCFYDNIVKISESVSIRFRDAGHILGSAIVEIWIREGGKETKLVFSGDLGMPGKPLLKDPTFIDECDYLIMESTYGNTVHENYADSIDALVKIIDETAMRGGTVVIPAFAVGRTQELIYELNNYYEYAHGLEEHQRIPIYVDSPMGILATKAFMRNTEHFNDKAREQILNGDNIFEFPNLKYTSSVEESKMLNKVRFPRVIISSSGTATAGRVRHHLKHTLWDSNSSVVFVGYQAEGTLGRILEDGAKVVKITGEEIAVKASIYKMEGFSGHADEPMLLEWVSHFNKKPKKVFLVHGEIDESEPLKKVLTAKLGLDVMIPNLGESYDITATREAIDVPVRTQEGAEALERELKDIITRINALDARQRDLAKDVTDDEYTALKHLLLDMKSDVMALNVILGK